MRLYSVLKWIWTTETKSWRTHGGQRISLQHPSAPHIIQTVFPRGNSRRLAEYRIKHTGITANTDLLHDKILSTFSTRCQLFPYTENIHYNQPADHNHGIMGKRILIIT